MYSLIQGHIQPIIGALSWIHLARDPLPRRFRQGRHQLQLRQVRPMILAMPVLHHARISDLMIAIGRGAIQPHRGDFQRVHLGAGRPHCLFQRRPFGVHTKTVQQVPQAIITEVYAPQGLSQQTFQHLAMPPGPVFDARLPVVAFRQHVGQPDDGELAVAQALLQPVGTQAGVHGRVQLQDLAQFD